MQRLYSYISTFLIVVFTVSSILQFHHHDIDGVIGLIHFDKETCVINSHRCCHIERSDTHNNNNDNDECCALKLSVQKRPSRQANICEICALYIILIIGFLVPNNYIHSIFVEHYAYPIKKQTVLLPTCKYQTQKFRAPPYFIR